jgi:hypothetical protein
MSNSAEMEAIQDAVRRHNQQTKSPGQTPSTVILGSEELPTASSPKPTSPVVNTPVVNPTVSAEVARRIANRQAVLDALAKEKSQSAQPVATNQPVAQPVATNQPVAQPVATNQPVAQPMVQQTTTQQASPKQVSPSLLSKNNEFVADVPNDMKTVPRPQQVMSNGETRVLGRLVFSYVPLETELKSLGGQQTAVFGRKQADGSLEMMAEFSPTNFMTRMVIMSKFTFEGVMTCDFKPKVDQQRVSFQFVHLEPIDYKNLVNAIVSAGDSDTIEVIGFYRPVNVPDANSRIGSVTYTIRRIGEEFCLEKLSFVIRMPLMSVWARSINDMLHVDNGGFPMIEMMNMNVARKPPGASSPAPPADNVV